MVWHIFTKDMKRKKTMNGILLAFIILAAMFTASSLSVMVSVLRGADYFADISDVGDVFIMGNGEEEDLAKIQQCVENSDMVDSFRVNRLLALEEGNFLFNGEALQDEGMFCVLTPSENGMKYFDHDDQVLTADRIHNGEVYLTKSLKDHLGAKVGDTITVQVNGKKMDLTLAGTHKDCIYGISMNSTSVLISAEDMDSLLQGCEGDARIGNMYFLKTDHPTDLKNSLGELNGVSMVVDRDLLKLMYVPCILISGIFLIVGVILIAVSFLILRFSIRFSISEEFREIGVMKAIGIGNFKIRSIFTIKYICIGIIGCVIGLVFSFPFATCLKKISMPSMVMGNSLGAILNVVGVLAILLAIFGIAFRFTGLVKRSTPIEAIRNGQTGERYKQKSVLHLGRSKLPSPSFLAINDILSTPRRYISMVIIFALCVLLTLILSNSVVTLRSEALVETCGFMKADLYATLGDAENRNLNGIDSEETIRKCAEDTERELAEHGIPAKLSTRYVVNVNLESPTAKGMHTGYIPWGSSVSDYQCIKGSVPKAANEIMITKQVGKELDVSIGDTVMVDTKEGRMECMVTGYYDCMNSLGDAVLLHEDFPYRQEDFLSGFMFDIRYEDSDTISDQVRASREATVKALYKKVYTAGELADKITGCSDSMAIVEKVLLGVTVVVILLAVILMERSFIADEKSQIALLKAVGMKDSKIIRWHVVRFSIVSIVAALLAMALNVPMTALLLNPIFKMMGGDSISYSIAGAKVFILYPLVAVIATACFTFLVAQYTRTITARDTASIE